MLNPEELQRLEPRIPQRRAELGQGVFADVAQQERA